MGSTFEKRWWFGVVLLLFVLAAIFAGQVSPYDLLLYHPAIVEQAPSWAHLFGTDSLGRDQLSRVIALRDRLDPRDARRLEMPFRKS